MAAVGISLIFLGKDSLILQKMLCTNCPEGRAVGKPAAQSGALISMWFSPNQVWQSVVSRRVRADVKVSS